jgi:hypothetical protein
LLPVLCAMLGTDPCHVNETDDPGWMVRVLQPIRVRRANDGEQGVDIGSTQEFVKYWGSDSRTPVWWDADGF